ncbi:hemolysin family protein [Veillonella sp. CHU110]|uniref:hemolysin family protein n=1 Tax=Veillonella sp. CHU110 TaxID=2490947 RepID=UPI000F8D9518|nr:hemolysin family protein [Veillonella sp. CHU110]
MGSDIGIEILIVAILIILNGLFSMTELAIINARKGLLEEKAEAGNRGARIAIKLAEDPNEMFSTIQIGITLISIVTGLYSGATFSDPMATYIKEHILWLADYADTVSPIFIVSLTTYLSLVIGELVPKSLAYNSPESIAIIMAIPMKYFATVTKPLVALLSMSTTMLLKVLGVKHKEEAPVTESEINKMLVQGVELGAYEEEEPVLVENIFRLADLDASDIMTPRTQLTWIDINASDEEILETIMECNEHRIPVGDDSLDELKGLVSSVDVLAQQMKESHRPMKDILAYCMRKPVLVPESLSLMKVLSTFREEGTHEAIVLDEYGGMSGMITFHDIMEEIVGLMPSGEEEKKEEENRIVQREDGTYLVDGLISIEELKEYFKVDELLPGEEDDLYKTLGGFVTYLIGRIPKEANRCHYGPLQFEVMDMDNTRVDKVMVTRKVEAESNSD